MRACGGSRSGAGAWQWLGMLGLGVVLLTAGGGCDRQEAGGRGKRARPTVEVKLASSALGSVQRRIDVTGSLEPDEDVVISAKVSGRVAQVWGDVGDRLRAGQVLAQIEKRDYELEVTQKRMALQETLARLGLTELPGRDFDLGKVPGVVRAQRQADNALAKLERARKLHQQTPPLISDQDFADLQTACDVAQADVQVERLNAQALQAQAQSRQGEIEIAQQRLADTTIRTPSEDSPESSVEVAKKKTPGLPAGAMEDRTMSPEAPPVASPQGSVATQPARARFAVAQKLVSVGEYVREGAPMFRVVADDPVKLRAAVPERYQGEIRPGQRVRVTTEGDARSAVGVVARISPQIDRGTRAFEIEVTLPNADGRLKPGAFARAAVQTRVEDGVTFVPAGAVVSFAGLRKVFTVQDGKAVEHVVETGVTQEGLVEIVRGLTGVQPVVVDNAQNLAQDSPVVVK